MLEYTHIRTYPSLERGRLDREGGERAGSGEVEREKKRVGRDKEEDILGKMNKK